MSLLDTLPDRPALDRLWRHLPQARLVGGSVRDLLRGETVNDLDLATPEPPDHVQEVLERAGIRVVPTGLRHGTVTAVVERRPFEITTLRRDEETDGRHAVVVWTQDWREDAARRDFTINAMSCDREGRIHDYFGGRDDLAAHRVRFVGDPSLRITEDALRILRFFRFDARFGSAEPDAEALRAIRSGAHLVESLSAERIASELLRILAGPRLMTTLEHMKKADILHRIVPDADLTRLSRLLACDDPHDPLIRLGALSPAGNRVFAEDLAVRLRLSNRQAGRLAGMALSRESLKPGATDDDLRRSRFDTSLETLLDRSWLAQADEHGTPDTLWTTLRARLEQMPRPVFPLAGRDLLRTGIAAGPAMGETLRQLQTWWRNQGCRPDREACLSQATHMLALPPEASRR